MKAILVSGIDTQYREFACYEHFSLICISNSLFPKRRKNVHFRRRKRDRMKIVRTGKFREQSFNACMDRDSKHASQRTPPVFNEQSRLQRMEDGLDPSIGR
jgi:hypothetical protein